MRKSREFDNVLDVCLERLLVKGEAIEQCLQSFPEHRDELKPLLETALATKKVSAIQPSPEFREKARYQFYSALQGVEPKKRYLVFGWQPRWVTVVAVVLVLLLAGSGTVAAAGGSMPDDPLYPVKLATEQVQLVFTPSALGKAELYAKLAEKRVDEIAFIASKDEPEQIEQSAQRLDAYLNKIADLASTQEVTGEVAMTWAVEETTEVEEEPPSLAAKASDSKEAHVKTDRRANLKETVESQAQNNTARLRALLETVPESARPALLRAIAIAETGYEKALESLE